MPYSTEEVQFLIQHKSNIEDVLTELGTADKRDTMRYISALRSHFGSYGRAVMELATARATQKLPQHWLMDTDSAQQATHPLVSKARAATIAAALPGARVADVTCSIGAEMPALAEHGLNAVGSDIDHTRLQMARSNVNAPFIQADALQPCVNAEVMIADPARRANGKRIWKPEDLLPPLPALLERWQHSAVAVKCAPGLDYSFWDGGVQVVSVDGGVKELCLYSNNILQGRQALVLSSTGKMETINSSDPSDIELSDARRFIIEPDGAIIRAGLVRHFAHKANLSMLDEHIAFLTGDHIPAGCSGFPYIEQVSLKQLKPALKAHDCGSLEILVRGVDVDPDQLRKKLKLRGTRPMAVVIARVGEGKASHAVAYICGNRQHGAVA
ncbi:class I SAM-dependent methyltransferase [Corynebacterium gerontici]|uniref:THUMP-like domain-containing protein n=1 Tax=Corynebacterium gerontici TaxID=2079234 RepID=A0A3G6J008_9CORY|nr:SAM-dependent methyltransferase [Corynebacterium gerontici]AZA11256.1 hypothetical protein CGERO_04700 [Corynebacterium gerontici]